MELGILGRDPDGLLEGLERLGVPADRDLQGAEQPVQRGVVRPQAQGAVDRLDGVVDAAEIAEQLALQAQDLEVVRREDAGLLEGLARLLVALELAERARELDEELGHLGVDADALLEGGDRLLVALERGEHLALEEGDLGRGLDLLGLLERLERLDVPAQRAQREAEAAVRRRAVRVDGDPPLVLLDRGLVLAEVALGLGEVEEGGLHPLVALDGRLERADGVEVLAVLEVVEAEGVVHARHLGLQAHRVAQRLGGLLRAAEGAVGLAEVREGERVGVVVLRRVLEHLDGLAVAVELGERLSFSVERVDLVAADLERLLERVERLLVAAEAVERLGPAPLRERVVLAAGRGLRVGGRRVLVELDDLLLLRHPEPDVGLLGVEIRGPCGRRAPSPRGRPTRRAPCRARRGSPCAAAPAGAPSSSASRASAQREMALRLRPRRYWSSASSGKNCAARA
ncbi:MAG: hypothetical protein M5U28_11675 [Sandaracinaceae bacterium]|nr:hypothetical protein [Sandaracinaceae bacterium]